MISSEAGSANFPDLPADKQNHSLDSAKAFMAAHMKLPLVTLIVINRNQSEHLAGLIGSIRNQDYPRFETIIVDNDSADDSCDIVEREIQGDHRFQFIRCDHDIGEFGAALCGLDLARGAFVTFLVPTERLSPVYTSTHVQVHLALPRSVAFTSCGSVKTAYDGSVLATDAAVVQPPKGPSDTAGLRSPMAVPRLPSIDAQSYELLHINTTTTPANNSPDTRAVGAENMYRRFVLELVRPPKNSEISPTSLAGPYFSRLSHFVGSSARIGVPLVTARSWAEDYSLDARISTDDKKIRRSTEKEHSLIMLGTLLRRAAELNWRMSGRLWRTIDFVMGVGKQKRLPYADTAVRTLLAKNLPLLLDALPVEEAMKELRSRLGRRGLKEILGLAYGKELPPSVEKEWRKIQDGRRTRSFTRLFLRKKK